MASGKLMKMMRKDAVNITKRIGFEEEITISTKDGLFSFNTTAIHTQHHLSYDTEGQMVNSKNAHILVAESDFIENEYPYRNETKNVSLINHRVTVNSDTGSRDYIVAESYPSDTFGMIVLILKDNNTNKVFDGRNNRKYSNPKF